MLLNSILFHLVQGCWLTWERHWTWRRVYDQWERTPSEQV